MGKIRPTYIKRIAIELVEKFPEAFSDDFQNNKHMVQELTDVRSTTLRNRVAGYITSYRKRSET